MVEFIALVVVWIVAFVSGWTARERYAERQLSRLMEETEESVRDKIEQTFIHIEIEKHNNQYFAYNMKDKTFMGQGDNQQALEKILMDKYPGKKFAAKHENLVEVGFIHATDSE